jgi:hypothetical protein
MFCFDKTRELIYFENEQYKLEKKYNDFTFMARKSNEPLLFEKGVLFYKKLELSYKIEINDIYDEHLYFKMIANEKKILMIHNDTSKPNPLVINFKE